MKLVIEIDKDKNDRLDYLDVITLKEIIRNGKPLPDGHGRLVDGDSLKNCFHYGEANTNNENDMIMAARRIIESVPTVIEADKESEE